MIILDGSFFGGYKNILPSMLTILPLSSTRATLLTSLAIYSCITLKAIQYYIIIECIAGICVGKMVKNVHFVGGKLGLFVDWVTPET